MERHHPKLDDGIGAHECGRPNLSSLPLELRRWLRADDPWWAKGLWLLLALALFPAGALVVHEHALALIALSLATMSASFLVPIEHSQRIRIDRRRISIVGKGVFEQRVSEPISAFARVVWGSRAGGDASTPSGEEHIVHLEHAGTPGWAVVLYAGRNGSLAHAWWWGIARLLELDPARLEVDPEDVRFSFYFSKYDDERLSEARSPMGRTGPL